MLPIPKQWHKINFNRLQVKQKCSVSLVLFCLSTVCSSLIVNERGVDSKSCIMDRLIHRLVLVATTLAREVSFWFQDGTCGNKVHKESMWDLWLCICSYPYRLTHSRCIPQIQSPIILNLNYRQKMTLTSRR